MKAVSLIKTVLFLLITGPVSGQDHTLISTPDRTGHLILDQKITLEIGTHQWMSYPRILQTTVQSTSSDRFSSFEDAAFFKLPDPSPTSFFCRMELRMEKRTGFPLRFRLGSLEYTNALERMNSLK